MTRPLGFISAALARLPGLAIYLSRDIISQASENRRDRHRRLRIGEDLGDEKSRLTTIVENGDGGTVIDGEAVVSVDELPESQP